MSAVSSQSSSSNMRVTIFGSGDIGLVTGECLAETGNDVLSAQEEAATKEETRQVGEFLLEIVIDALEATQLQEDELDGFVAGRARSASYGCQRSSTRRAIS